MLIHTGCIQYSSFLSYSNLLLQKCSYGFASIVSTRKYLSSTNYLSYLTQNNNDNLDLSRREMFANKNRGDASLQSDYLRLALEKDPMYVIRRYESGIYAVNSECRELYLKALSTVTKSGGAKGNISDQISTRLGLSSISSDGKSIESKGKTALLKPIELICLSVLLGYVLYKVSRLVNITKFDVSPVPISDMLTFNDVKGCAECKEELMELVQFLTSPDKFLRMGAKIMSGVLMVGPPGTGKTLMAKAVAGEANVPFYYFSGSEFDEVFVGVGASRIKKIFEKARETAPCIVFIDELDALGGKRNAHDSSYSRLTLNQFLTELDGFRKNDGVVIIGATNFPQSLDHALTRPGRFDSRIYVPLPSYADRIEICQHYLNLVKAHKSISAKSLASLLPGSSGADIKNVINQAAVRAAVKNRLCVMPEDIEWARIKVSMGRERRGLIMSDKDKEMTAYHEAGHALVAYFTEGADKPHRATIIPRGESLGVTETFNENERVHYTYKQLLAKVDVCMGGRAAEELLYGPENVTTGCSSDLSTATNLLRGMIRNYGMGKKSGLLATEDKLSETTDAIIDAEVKELLQQSYNRAKELLKNNSDAHNRLSRYLIKHESIHGQKLEDVILGKIKI